MVEKRILNTMADLKFKSDLVGLMFELVNDDADKKEIASRVLDLIEQEE